MAVRQPTSKTTSGDGSVIIWKFEGLTKTTDDTTEPSPWAEWADRSVQFLGTFGAGGTIVWEGSNDGGTTYFTLRDPFGNTISETGAGGEAVSEITGLARARVTAGDVTTDLDVYVLCRRQNPMRT